MSFLKCLAGDCMTKNTFVIAYCFDCLLTKTVVHQGVENDADVEFRLLFNKMASNIKLPLCLTKHHT